MRFTRMIVTAATARWVDAAVSAFTGYGTSVIQCDAEVGLERLLDSSEAFDNRPGASMLAFGFSSEALAEAIGKRSGQCLMTCATTAVFDGYPRQQYILDQQRLLEQKKKTDAKKSAKAAKVDDSATVGAKQSEGTVASAREIEPQKRIPVGSHLRFFGDGFQKSKMLGERRFWRIPVMDGEFIVEQDVGVGKGVAGGNFLIQSVDQMTGLEAAERAVDAIAVLPNVITPFPGGVVRSGSKVGSRYKGMVASTSHPYCPTLRGRVESQIHPDASCVYEIVIDGTDFESVAKAMRVGIHAAVGEGIVSIGAGNYDGKLGKHQFPLHQILEEDAEQTG